MSVIRKVVFSSFLVAIALAVAAPNSLAKDPPANQSAIEQVQLDIQQNSSALYRGDVDTVLNYTHPKVIQLLGGRSNARPMLEKALKDILADGIKVEEMTFPAAPTFLKGSENEFVIVPTKTIFSIHGTRIESLNYQFGARAIGSTQWTYIEGSRVNHKNVYTLFPDFPQQFQFPKTSQTLLE